MSDQYVFSRRKAIALFGISAAGIAAEAAQLSSAPAHAGSGELEKVDGTRGASAVHFWLRLAGAAAITRRDLGPS
jgi:hypothetical protein